MYPKYIHKLLMISMRGIAVHDIFRVFIMALRIPPSSAAQRFFFQNSCGNALFDQCECSCTDQGLLKLHSKKSDKL